MIRFYLLCGHRKNSLLTRLSVTTLMTFLFVVLIFKQSDVEAQTPVPYIWKNAKAGGGGYVPGIIYSKAQAGLVYARTDVGGAYRWNPTNKTWIPLNDMFGDFNDHGIISLAADPVDANRVYIAVGLYEQDWWSSPGRVYASTDKGTTWTMMAQLPFKLGGNDPGRGSGERLQVDPNKNNVLYLGSNTAGLWKSEDYGATWGKVTSFPATKITFVEFDKSSGKAGESTKTIYVGVWDHLPSTLAASIYRSTDSGVTWQLLPGQPTSLPKKSWDPKIYPAVANRVTLAGNYLYISYASGLLPNGDYRSVQGIANGAVFRYNKVTGEWKDITPARDSQGGYGGISSSPSNPNLVIVSTSERWWPQNELHMSGDGGNSWRTVILENTWSNTPRATLDYSKHPWASTGMTPHWTSTVEIDPFNSNNSMFGTGYGVFVSTNLLNGLKGSTHWVFENEGLEETVPQDLISPPSGAHLLSAIADFSGYRYDNFDVSAPRFNDGGGSGTSIDFAENNPSLMVRTKSSGTTSSASYSTNGGVTWKEFSARPVSSASGGTINISSNGTSIVYNTRNVVYYSKNMGATWATSSGIPNIEAIGDRSINDTFYGYERTSGKIYKSEDGGATFAAIQTDLLAAWSGMIFSVFGKPGHLWVANSNGLFYSTDGGITFTKISAVQEGYNVTAGKAAPGKSYPAIFLYGKIDNVIGLYRSDNAGAAWVKVHNDQQNFGGQYRSMTADRRIFGRLYIGTSGRGVVYGTRDLSQNINPVASATADTTSGYAPFVVSFNSEAYDIEGDSLTFTWNFGDGSTSTGASATHVYTRPGEFTATLTVNDGRGGIATVSFNITSKSGLSLQYRTKSNPAKLIDAQIVADFQIVNNSPNAVPYDELTIRYWYTREGSVDQQFTCDQASIGAGRVAGKFVSLDQPSGGADNYLEVSFTAAGELLPGTLSGAIETQFNKVDGSDYNEENDYSFNSSLEEFGDWSLVTLYRNGELFWGTEPAGASVESTASNSVIINNHTLAIYPNPSSTYFTVETNGRFDYIIKDGLGLVYEQGHGNNKAEIGNTLPSGIFVLEIRKNAEEVQFRLVKN